MSKLIPVQYHNKHYPEEIVPTIREVAGHFDKNSIDASGEYSLHTEYSYMGRDLDSPLIRRFPTIQTEQRRGIPKLWATDEWASEFAQFIEALVDGGQPPRIVEVHPPFDDVLPTAAEFVSRYAIFEEAITSRYPSVAILIENRYGSQYNRGRFLISLADDVLELCEVLDSTELRLDFALDVPQVISAHGGAPTMTEHKLDEIFATLRRCRHRIRGIHMWGKRTSSRGARVTHAGDLNSYFDGNAKLKQHYLEGLYELLDDGRTRYFVPEVNSKTNDLVSIVRDMEAVGFSFGGAT